MLRECYYSTSRERTRVLPKVGVVFAAFLKASDGRDLPSKARVVFAAFYAQ
jgi:hypothetical protein